MEKETAQDLEKYFIQNTKFMFHPKVSFKKHDNCHGISKDQFQMMKFSDDFSYDLYDAFMLYAIYSLGHATKHQVIEWMDIYQKRYPKKSLPKWNTEKVTKRLNSLAARGLIYCYDYVSTESDVILIYTCSYFGHVYFKNTLDMSYMPFDENAIFHAEVETFKRLSAASVTLGLARTAECCSVSIGGRLLFGRDLKQRASLFTYGWLIIEHNGLKKMYVVEPIYFSVNEKVLSKEEAMNRTEKRMHDLENFCNSIRKTMDICVVPVFCLENMDGLKRLCQIAKNRKGTDIYQRALYTSENVVYNFGCDMNKVFVTARFERRGDDVHVQMLPVGDKWME